MYKDGKYRETDKMSDLICDNYPMVLVLNRFGIGLGLIPIVFAPMLAFGKAEFQEKEYI